MKAAVVHGFDPPLAIEDVPIPEPGAEQVLVRIEASGLCHTDIHAARGEWPVKPAPPFIPGHEGVGIIERIGPGNAHGLQPRHARRAAVARLRVRRLPLLQHRLGDALRVPAEHGLRHERRRSPSTPSATRATSCACPTASTRSTPRRSPAPASPPTRRSRSRAPARRAWSRSSAPAASATSRSSTPASPAPRSSPSTSTRSGCASPASSAPSTSSTPREEDPIAAIQAPRRRRPGDLDRRHPVGVRAGARLARPRRHARLRRPARRQRHAHADLRDGPRRPDRQGLDRRHPPRPRGGLRAAPPRPDDGRARRARARRRQRGDRAGARRQRPGAAHGLPHVRRAEPDASDRTRVGRPPSA